MITQHRFLICGSGASEGIPALFCNCPVCRKARSRGGREQRTRTAYQLGGRIRFDFGPDLLWHQNRYHLELDQLRHLFITHGHKDHFTPLNLSYRRPQYVELKELLQLHAMPELLEQAVQALAQNGTDLEECRVRPSPLAFFHPEAFQGEDGMVQVTPLPSDHLPAGKTCIFDVVYAKRRILIGTDSGIYPDETWDYLQGKRFDLAVMDGTSGVLPLRHVHMGRACLVETVERLRRMKVYDRRTRVIANHFSHNGKMNHDDLEDFYFPHRIEVGYDGMAVDLDHLFDSSPFEPGPA